MKVYKWKSFCPGCNAEVIGYGPTAPVHCPIEGSSHVLDPASHKNYGEYTDSVNDLLDKPQGSGFKLVSPALTDFSSIGYDWTNGIAEGKKIVMLSSRIMVNLNIENMPAMVFEVQRKINFGLSGDPQYYTISQNHYKDLGQLAVEADDKNTENSTDGDILEANYIWPQFDDISRKPTVLYGTHPDRIRVYLTNADKNSGEGAVRGEEDKETYKLAGYTFYNNYPVITSGGPSWPAEMPKFTPNHVCLHAISYDEDQALPGE